ncbi:MAG: ChaN family lipoprotein, partial [Bacteroidota bacterium]
MLSLIKRCIVVLLVITVLVSTALAERQYAIYETATGKKISVNELAEKTYKTKIIFFGEFHDDTIIHDLQRDYLTALYKLNPKIAVSMEMFERDGQTAIDDYLSGKSSEESFLKSSRPWPDYKLFYRALLEIAKTNNAPVIASNIPRKYAGIYTNEGWSGIEKLPPNERAFVASKIFVEEDKYMQNFYRTMLANMGMDTNAVISPNQENTLYLYYGAQIIKDETMAESIPNFLQKNKEMNVIHFNGSFHSDHYLGTAKKVLERDKSYSMAVISPMYVDKGSSPDFDKERKDDGDYLIVLEEKTKEEYTQAMMGGHLGENFIAKHKIKIKLDPANHTIEGNDSLKFKNPIARKSSFKLLNDLKIESISSPNGDFDYVIKTDSLYQEIIITKKKAEISELNLTYKGIVYHNPSITLLNQKHSNTPGIISDAKGEGIYLPGGSYFPQADKDLADFNIEITLPKELTLVTSGTQVSAKEDGANKTYIYKSELPTDDMILVGGRYIRKDTVYDGKTFSLYTFAKSPAGEAYLNSSIQFYQYYTKILGAYPYSSFSIVENFFATGFGMPGYTLLSNKLMGMPWIVLALGSLAHEFVHNWWGNSVYVDYNAGNWCEALTTFCSNYYYNVLAKKPDAALDWRKKALLSLESLPEKDKYPVIKFKSQVNNNDAVIGYQKGGFFFYELLKLYGDEKFFSVLKQYASMAKGRRGTWNGITMMFTNKAKSDSLDIPVKKIFDQWLKENQVPTLTLENVKQDKDSLRFEINQDLQFYLPVPVRIYTATDTIRQNFTIKDRKNSFAVKTNADVKSITVDLDYQCLRRLNKWEIPFSFGLTLSDNPLLILPSKSSKDYKV